ncbi:MAG: hypothetical protein WD738_04820 [Pirellulales bacterium]
MTYLTVALLVATYVLFTIWVLIRGWFDLLHMLAELRQEPVDLADDGRVSNASHVIQE